jgi:hypothetical protein
MPFVAKGTCVLLTFRETAVIAEVFLTSPDCCHLVVRFQGKVGPHYDLMQLVWVGEGYAALDGVYVGLMSLREVSPGSCSDAVRL